MLEAWFKPSTITIAPVRRTARQQREVDARTASLSLYHYETCLFCARVRRAVDALRLSIELRDIRRDAEHLRALVEGSGRMTVPCLRIAQPGGGQRWMFESADIIAYLVREFGEPASGA